MSKTENQKKLLKILNEIFQLDQSDLDFGIYRIMNTKSDEISEFLDKDLLVSVKKAFSKNENEAEQNELNELVKTLVSAGVNPDDSPKVKELKEKLSSLASSKTKENDVFSHLTTFFSRYYKDGDFVSLRRYKKDTYAIPYEGEEVKLHWANSDQYYIKSGEYFRDYSFKVDDKTIHFKLSDAQTCSNNNKATNDKERRFIYIGSEVLTPSKELNINFEYKAVGKSFRQDKLNEEAISKVLEDLTDVEFITALNTLAPTEKNKKRTIFEKHLKSYTSRNSFDYFIHKDLGGFLNRELDFYIKNEMLCLDDIMDSPIKYDEVMGRIKIFKEVAGKIIAFLTQLEELQKRLWEKKKFVIETNYCITLDKIDEKYHKGIFENQEQLKEWKELFNIDIQNLNDLKEEKYLVLDTKFFDMKFKYKLLSEFDNLDEQIDGVLINSENFGALNLLQQRYKEQVKTVYIDPPYNTGNDGFLYNDSFQHSSWMSFIDDRISKSKKIMSKNGAIFINIDDNEINNLRFICDNNFDKDNFLANVIWKHTQQSKNDEPYFSRQNNALLVYRKSNLLKKFRLPRSEQDNKNYSNPDNDINGDWRSGDVRSPSYRKTLCFNIITPSGKVIKPPKDGWRWMENTLNEKIKSGEIIFNNDETKIIRKIYLKKQDGRTPENIWSGEEYGTTRIANSELKSLFDISVFNTPKPTQLIKKICQLFEDKNQYILDFFAGSGTTGHAVINLNREDNGKRKYLLVEMGEYFDSVTKPRIQKVIYSDSWKDGKPQTKNGISQIFKYFKLESYEDTLNNLEFKKTDEQQKAFDFHPQAKEDYILNYSLRFESEKSLLNIDSFKTPFNYKLKIAISSVGETKDTTIDLVETFNYLLGLVVEKIDFSDGFLTIKGKNLKGVKILIIWRDNKTNDELDEFVKSIKLDDFDTIFVNGDNNLGFKLVEFEFKRLMFNE